MHIFGRTLAQNLHILGRLKVKKMHIFGRLLSNSYEKRNLSCKGHRTFWVMLVKMAGLFTSFLILNHNFNANVFNPCYITTCSTLALEARGRRPINMEKL